MSPARRSGKKLRQENGDKTPRSAVLLVSSSDEEANGDLSAWIVARSKKREEERSAARRNQEELIEVDSSESLEILSVKRREEKKKKKKKKQKKKCKGEPPGDAVRDLETAQSIKNEEESVLTHSVELEKNEEIQNNIVYRKLLRGPRYFEPGSAQQETCYNCGEEGHIAANCKAEKRQKPCFVCGMFGHNSYKCNQGQDCFICKRRGHLAKDCPEKHKTDHQQDAKLCIRCGGYGHDMASCRNDYPSEDLSKIKCYVCGEFGHFCCAMYKDTSPGKISCYNCGDSSHSGMGCAKPKGEAADDTPAKSCYICGEEGHFARGCTKRSSSSSSKRDKRRREESLPSTPKLKERTRSATSSHSKRKEPSSWPRRKPYSPEHNRHETYLPPPYSPERNRQETYLPRGGWIEDDFEYFDQRPRSRPWTSPYNILRTPPSRRSFHHYDDRYYWR